MAKLLVFACRDSKLGLFLNPMFFHHLGQAARQWEEVVNMSDTLPGKYPADFSFFQIGEFDDEAGAFTTITPHLVATGLDVKAKPRVDQTRLTGV